MEVPEIDAIEFDRTMRSYITAMLLEDHDEQLAILDKLDRLKSHPLFTVFMMMTFQSMTGFLLATLADSSDLDEVFEFWTQVSGEIEMNEILGDHG